MAIWQLQEAKAKLTELIKQSKKAPQIISRRGINEVAVMNIETYEAFLGKTEHIISFFQNSPLKGLELELKRDKSSMRDNEDF